MLQRSCFRPSHLVFVPLILSFSALPQAFDTMPEEGNSAIYRDIDYTGRILEIDYLSNQARLIGTLDSEADRISHSFAYDLANGDLSLLFHFEPNTENRARMRLFSAKNGTISDSGITIDLKRSELAILSVAADFVLINYTDPEDDTGKQIIYDATQNRIRGNFSFRIDADSFFSLAPEGTSFYVAHPTERRVVKVNRETSQVEFTADMSELVVDDQSDELAFVTALSGNLAFVNKKYRAENRIRLHLVDLDSLAVIALSESMEFFNGRYLFEDGVAGKVKLVCIERTIKDGRRVPAGILHRFEVDGQTITRTETTTYDPSQETVLRDSSGSFVITRKREYDYLSMRTIAREIHRRFPTAAVNTTDPKKRIREQVIEEFNNPKGEGFTSRTLTHLEIR